MGIWRELFGLETREQDSIDIDSHDQKLMNQIFGIAEDNVTPKDVLEIPIVNACLTRISHIVASSEIKMYEKTDKGIKQIKNDVRVQMLNTSIDNGTMNSFEFKKTLVQDYYLKGHSYFYIKRKGNKVKDIVYLPEVSVTYNSDIFNKHYKVMAQTKELKLYETLRVTRNTGNGVTGTSIVKESNLHFLLTLKTMERMLLDVKRGFLPKGFFKTDANVKRIDKIREDVNNIINDIGSGYMILNRGIDFEPLDKKKDVEKEVKANTQELNKIASMFGIPISIITGGASEEDKYNFINFTILPLFATIEASLNRDLLLENEKDRYYFSFETRKLLKGNMYERYKAYEIAIKNNTLSMDEVRDLENMERLNFNFYKMNIADAFYYPDKQLLVNVNSGVALDLDNVQVTTSVEDVKTNQNATIKEDKKLTKKGGGKIETESIPEQSND